MTGVRPLSYSNKASRHQVEPSSYMRMPRDAEDCLCKIKKLAFCLGALINKLYFCNVSDGGQTHDR